MLVADPQPTIAPHQRRLTLTGMGHYHPQHVLDNAFFERLDIGASAAWTLERVGIHSRHSVLSSDDILSLRRGETSNAQLVASGRVMSLPAMCEGPWRMATGRAREQGHDAKVDTVIAGTSVPDWDIPANACAIAAAVGLECTAFDVNSACSSFIVDLHVARSLLLSGAAQDVAVFNPERYTTRLDYTDRGNCMLFGDGATAALLSSQPGLSGLELLDTLVQSAPSGHLSVRIPAGGQFWQNGAAVQKFAVTKTVAVSRQLLSKHGLTARDLSYFVGHQANLRMLTSVCDKLGIAPEQHLHNVAQRGNQGGAGAPAVLSSHWEAFKPGQLILVAVVGSGLSWGSALLRCV